MAVVVDILGEIPVICAVRNPFLKALSVAVTKGFVSVHEGTKGSSMTDSPYCVAEVYDIAFTFRDYSKAVDFLIEASLQAGLTKVSSMVELGCGPGQYCREFSRRGITSYGIDRSPEMVLYAWKLCEQEKLTCQIIEADCLSFNLPQPVDLAVCMMATFNLLLTNDDTIAHLRNVADNLIEGGLYIIELNHPRDIFQARSSTNYEWEIERDGIKVKTNWGSDATIDPLTEIETGTIIYTVEKDGAFEQFVSRERWRDVSFGLISALIELSGRFKIIATYGDLDLAVPFDNDKKAWRMVLVLRKIR